MGVMKQWERGLDKSETSKNEYKVIEGREVDFSVNANN